MSEDLPQTLRVQAEVCRRLGSPFTAALLDGLAERLRPGTPLTDRLFDWPGDPQADALALRLAGALHALVLQGRDPALSAQYPPAAWQADRLGDAALEALARHAAFVDGWIDQPPQTNEVARSAMLLPGLVTVAAETGLPLSLLEIGSSAGLNLLPDRWRYRYGDREAGPDGAPFTLAPDASGTVPVDPFPRIASRAGCDRNPLDAASREDRLRLESYVWADQADRLARLRAALDAAAAAGLRVERADAAGWLATRLHEPPQGTARVVFHTIVWQYLADGTRRQIRETLEAAGERATAERPLAWLRLEPAGAGIPPDLTLTLWPGGAPRILAGGDWHGRSIDWH